MGYKLKTAPTVEPITLSEAKLHLKLDSDTTDDTLITALITAAREACENFTGRAFVNQTWEATFDEFPAGEDEIELYPAPLSSITSLTYKDVNNATQTAAATVYEADPYSLPGTLALKYGQSWPVALEIQNSITVTYVAGYGATAASVPGPIKAAMLLLIGHLYENRESVEVGQTAEVLPHGVEFLLSPYRVISFA